MIRYIVVAVASNSYEDSDNTRKEIPNKYPESPFCGHPLNVTPETQEAWPQLCPLHTVSLKCSLLLPAATAVVIAIPLLRDKSKRRKEKSVIHFFFPF